MPVLSWDFFEKATFSKGNTLRTWLMLKLIMIEAKVPPKTINTLEKLQNNEMSPSITIETISSVIPMIIPNSVARSICLHSIPSWVWRGCRRSPCQSNPTLSFQVYKLLQHFIGRGNDPGVRLEASLGNDHLCELFTEIHIGHFQ